MARELRAVSEASCNECGNDRIDLGEFHAEGNSSKGDKHMETYSCAECRTQGVVEFTPPTSSYTLKGPLFGEPEDVDELIQEARQLE